MMQLQCFLPQPQEKYLSINFQNIQVKTPSLDFGDLYSFATEVIKDDLQKLFIAELCLCNYIDLFFELKDNYEDASSR